ncbi:MAG: translation initiation factor [Myxococcales bacterium]|nr:translation initiation factor [Myxococcales bacterium]
MGKKKGREDRSQSQKEQPFNNPFAALGVMVDVQESKIPSVEVSSPDAETPSSGPAGLELMSLLVKAPKLVVRKEKKGRGGKTVTRVDGLPWDTTELSELARMMAKVLGCGVSVDNGSLLAQGSQSTRIAAFLKQKGARSVVVGDSSAGCSK